MGFRLETADGPSIAIKAAKKHGAPPTVNLEKLLEEPSSKRAKWFRDRTDRKLTEKVGKAVREATTIEGLHAALDSVIDRKSTPDFVVRGAMVLQPSEERRRSGSHYTPRELTGPIVQRALEPVLDRLRGENGKPPRPEQILDLKVCDPAAGSGAFLVEACRTLGDALVEAWHAHDKAPDLAGEDEIVFARRLIARRCLYGVDRNPVAVDLTKLSLWLVTLARDQPLTFVDHSIRHGDSLVGLSRRQIEAFHWKGDAPAFQEGWEAMQVRKHMDRIASLRKEILQASRGASDLSLHSLWMLACEELDKIRLFGDLVLLAFFSGSQHRYREAKRLQFADSVLDGQSLKFQDEIIRYKDSEYPLAQFHWEIEFPEVFERTNPGFDVMVGNPPFAGKNTLAAGNLSGYPDWLKSLHTKSHGNADVVAHFFRRSFDLIRRNGVFGLIATNTISQGDTRSTSLEWICEHDGCIYNVLRRFKWPGLAAVVVSVIHIAKGTVPKSRILDGHQVNEITAFLFHSGQNESPVQLKANERKSFQGSVVLGLGFTFDDKDSKQIASPVSEMRRLTENNDHNKEAILAYIGGKELNSSPTCTHHRYVINFWNFPLCRTDLESDWRNATIHQQETWLHDGIVPNDYPHPVAADWPDLLRIVEEKVKPERSRLTRNSIGMQRAKFWWQYGASARNLYAAVAELKRVLALAQVSQHLALAFLPSRMVFSCKLYVFPFASYAAFCALQSRVHETWARLFGSTLKDDLSYNNTDCFETFPFPKDWETHSGFETAGKAYYEFRAELMVSNNEGLTKTYNRFHDPNEEDSRIMRLRKMHADMDRAVLDAYGWTDIPTECEFLLDYEIDEEEWSKKKKPWRYRWPDAVRDEVLGRLLELNAQRAAEEKRSGASAKPRQRTKRSPRGAVDKSPSLFP